MIYTMFTEMEKQVFYILGRALFGDENCPSSAQPELLLNANWGQIYEEMQAQTVTALSVNWINKQPFIDEAVKAKWSMASIVTVRRWLEIMTGQEELTELLKLNGIDFAILKGSAAAIYYPHPEYRVMGDIDFIVREEEVSHVHELMLGNGYQDSVRDVPEINGMPEKHHIILEKGGIDYELHWNLPLGRQDKQVEDKIPEWLEQGIRQSEENTIEDFHVKMFPWELNGLILLRHMMQHVQEKKLGLRQIIDWMMFVNAYLDDMTWDQVFHEIAAAAGLETLAVHATRACQLYLGLREDGISWCLCADPQVSEELLKSIINAGNYGMKAFERERGFTTIVRYRTVISLVKSLQPIGLERWKLAQKHPFLRPFAWIYQIGRSIGLIMKKKNPFKTMLSLSKERHEYENMLEKLGIGWVSTT